MSIQSMKDPRTGKEVLFAKGKITGIFFNKIKNVKTYTTAHGQFTPTHVVNVKIGEDVVSFGTTAKEVIKTKHEGEWIELQRGMTITVDVEKQISGQYTNYNADKKSLMVLDATPDASEQKTNQGSSSSGGYKRDTTGMECGHAINGAMNLLKGKITKDDDFLEYAKQIHDATVTAKAKFKESNPDADDYTVGATVGNAVLNVCTILPKTKVDQVADKAISFLENYSAPLLAYIRGEDTQGEAQQQEETPEQPEDNLDDDIPF